MWIRYFTRWRVTSRTAFRLRASDLMFRVSPDGELLSFACAKESNQRKAHPEASVACGDFPALLSGASGCGTRSPAYAGSLRQSSPKPCRLLRCSATHTGPQEKAAMEWESVSVFTVFMSDWFRLLVKIGSISPPGMGGGGAPLVTPRSAGSAGVSARTV